MIYTSGEIAGKLVISKDCLRYYEREGLLPQIERDSSGRRIFSYSDFEWVFLIKCLRDTDMPIAKIKEYVSLLKGGGQGSVRARHTLLLEHERFIKEKIAAFQKLELLIAKKLEFYEDALRSDNAEETDCVDYAKEWEHFRSILGGIKHD